MSHKSHTYEPRPVGRLQRFRLAMPANIPASRVITAIISFVIMLIKIAKINWGEPGSLSETHTYRTAAKNLPYRRITNLCVKNILRIVHYKVVCVYIYAIL